MASWIPRSTKLAAIAAISGGCWMWQAGRAETPESRNSGENSVGRKSRPELHHYVRAPNDPGWLVRVGEFHGHLGPWVVLGAMVGRDGIHRLDTSGFWDIDVIVWMPIEHQRQPWSCVLDGLQVSTGATLGKRNIGFDYSPRVVREGRPVIHVRRLAIDSRPAAGWSYRVNDELARTLAQLSPDRLEQLSRDLARQRIPQLFEVRELAIDELPPAQTNRPAHSD